MQKNDLKSFYLWIFVDSEASYGVFIFGNSTFFGCVKSFCGKKISGKVNTFKGVFYINTLRMLLCVAIGFFVILFNNEFGGLKPTPYMLLITAISGISTALFLASWIICVQKGAYVMVEVFIMLGSMITIVLCNLFFDEAITVYHCVAFLLLLCSTYIMCSYSSNVKGKFTLSSFIILTVCGLCNGLTDFSQKWFVNNIPNGSTAVFNFYTYVFFCVGTFSIFCYKQQN